jgi:hypothetical protein
MSDLARQSFLFRPSTIAIHNDGNMLWHSTTQTNLI